MTCQKIASPTNIWLMWCNVQNQITPIFDGSGMFRVIYDEPVLVHTGTLFKINPLKHHGTSIYHVFQTMLLVCIGYGCTWCQRTSTARTPRCSSTSFSFERPVGKKGIFGWKFWLTTQQFWQKCSENIWKYLLYECSWDIHALHPREMWKVKVLMNKNWRSEHFRPLKRHVDNPIWQPEIRKLLKDFQTISCLSFQFNSTHKRKKWYWYWFWLQYLTPCWNEGKTCLKNKQDIIELQVCRWFRPLAITICSAYSALFTGLNVWIKTCNGLIHNPTPLAFYTLMRHPKTHNASSKPVVSTVSHSGERIRITSIRETMPGLWPTRSVCGYSKLPLSG